MIVRALWFGADDEDRRRLQDLHARRQRVVVADAGRSGSSARRPGRGGGRRRAPRAARRCRRSRARCRRARRRPCRRRGPRGSGRTGRPRRAWARAWRERRACRSGLARGASRSAVAACAGAAESPDGGGGRLLVRPWPRPCWRRPRCWPCRWRSAARPGRARSPTPARAAGIALGREHREVRDDEDEHRGERDQYGLGDLVHAPRIGAARLDLSA